MSGAIVEQARAKINLALHVLGRIADGYHELDSIVAFADVGDVLTLEEAGDTSLAIEGPFAAGLDAGADNLVLRAHHALAARIPLPSVRYNLRKNLPVASGIGGGSADAAAALRGLLRLTQARVDEAELRQLALSLGADVPVCLAQRSCRMRGVGEVIEPHEGPMPAHVVLANPGVPCGTAAVFSALGLKHGERHGTALDPYAMENWRNDLQSPALAVCPAIGDVLHSFWGLQGLGPLRMSGSGATCFAVAASREASVGAASALRQQHPAWWVEAATIR